MNTEFITRKFEQILPENFIVSISDEFIINFERVTSNKMFLIFVGDIQNLNVTNILPRLVFNDIEYILNPKFKLGYNNSTINININKYLFNHIIGEGILSQLPIDLDTEQGVDKACQLIEKYIEQEAVPFFNYWQDIRDFLPFLETDDINILSDIFTGDALFKKIIIWKLCSHPKYLEFTEKKTAQLTKRLIEIPKDNSFKKNYDKYIQILKTLEKTKPLYPWDDSYLIQKPYSR